MADNILISDEALKIVQTQATTWSALDQSGKNIEQLKAFATQFGGGAGVAVDSPLTAQPSPPAEVVAALSQLQQDQARIASLQRDIQSDRDQIKRIQSTMRNLIIAAVVVVLLIILFLTKVI
jgi:hypothetical protein